MRALSMDYGYDYKRNPSSSPRKILPTIKNRESRIESKAFRLLINGQGRRVVITPMSTLKTIN